MEAVECRLDELDVLGLEGEAQRLQHQLGLGPLEHAPGRRQHLRDGYHHRRAVLLLLLGRRSPLDGICRTRTRNHRQTAA